MTGMAALSRGAAALAWLAYAWVLARLLPADALGPVLYALGLSGLAGSLMAAGHAQLILRNGAQDPGQIGAFLSTGLVALGRGAILVTSGLMLAALLALLPFGIAEAALTAAAALIIGLTGLCAAAARARGQLWPVLAAQGPLRPGLPLLLTILAGGVGTGTTAILALFIAGLVLALLVVLPACPRPRRAAQADPAAAMLWQGQAGWLVFSQLDLIVAGLLLTGEGLASYLLFRRVASTAAMAFDAVRLIHARPLAEAFGDTPASGRAAAMTLNRAFLRVGGGTSLAVALFGSVCLGLFGDDLRAPPALFAALLSAQAVPALFGATGLILVMAGRETDRRRLLAAAVPAGGILCLAAGTLGPLALAVAAATVQAAHAGAASRLLWRTHHIPPPLFTAISTRFAEEARPAYAAGSRDRS